MAEMKTLTDVSGVQVPENIQVSENGRLFLVGGKHHVLNMFAAGKDGIPAAKLECFFSDHSRRKNWCCERGISMSQWVFPDPIVFQGTMPPGAVESVFLRSIPQGSLSDGIFYPLDVLDGYQERQSRTDTHYSPLGNMHVSAKVADATLGFHDAAELDRLRQLCVEVPDFAGDLGVQCSPAVKETRLMPPQAKGIQTATNGMQAGNNGIIQLVCSPEARFDRKLLIFGDSFFRSMLPELARYWVRIVFFRTPHFHYEMVSAVRPDDILCGMAERYFSSVLPDDRRPHFLAYPLTLGRGLAPDSGFSAMWNEMVDQQALGSIS